MPGTTSVTRRRGFKSAFMATALGVLLCAAAIMVPLWPEPAAGGGVNPRPDCFVVSVGVDTYAKVTGLNNLKGCENDATNLTSRMKDQAGKHFGTVDTRVLLSSDATYNSVHSALNQAAKKGKAGDWVVLVLSGHGGMGGDGRWAFMPTDGKGISDTEIVRWADTLASQGKKVWIIIDACECGGLRLNARELLELYQDPQGGGVLLMLAAMPKEESEALGQFSTYAQAVNEALAGDADFNGDGIVTLREVRQYAYHRAYELNHQHSLKDQNGECVASLSMSDNQPLAQAKTKFVLRASSELTLKDKKDTARKDSFAKSFSVTLQANTRYVIDLKSSAFDTYLRVEDATGRQVAFNDDVGGKNLNSQVVFTPQTAGTYRVIATTYAGGITGVFTLTVKQG
jgi:hypothetical protein